MSAPLHIISLGAGVQSSTMALMAAAGEITPMPSCAIFADTQAEPASVYRWLDWLEPRLPFPVHRVTAGSLTHRIENVRVNQKTGREYYSNMIPAFVRNQDGSRGIVGRSCTTNFKIIPITQKLREIIGRPAMLVPLPRARQRRLPVPNHSHQMTSQKLTRLADVLWANLQAGALATYEDTEVVLAGFFAGEIHAQDKWRDDALASHAHIQKLVERKAKELRGLRDVIASLVVAARDSRCECAEEPEGTDCDYCLRRAAAIRDGEAVLGTHKTEFEGRAK